MTLNNPGTLLALKAKSMVAVADDDVLYTYTVPTGQHFTVVGAIQVCTVAVAKGDTGDDIQVDLCRTPSGGDIALLKRLTAIDDTDAIGTTEWDDTPAVTATTNYFSPGDKLSVIGYTAPSTAGGGAGTIDLHLLVDFNN